MALVRFLILSGATVLAQDLTTVNYPYQHSVRHENVRQGSILSHIYMVRSQLIARLHYELT